MAADKAKQTGSFVPRYRVVVDDMIQQIETGRWPCGRAIPPINELVDRYPVSRMTVLKSMHVLEEEGYVSVEHGRGTIVRHELPGKRVGILCGDDIFSPTSSDYSSAVCHGLAAELRGQGLYPQIYVIENKVKEDSPYPNQRLSLDVRRRYIKGLIVLGTGRLPKLYADAIERRLPIVQIGDAGVGKERVLIDYRDFVKKSVYHLLSKGLDQIAVMASTRKELSMFEDELAEYNIKCNPHWMVALEGSRLSARKYTCVEARGFALFNRIWQAAFKPKALIVADDVLAKGAAQAMLVERIRVPRELSLLTVTNSATPVFFPVKVTRCEYDTSNIIEKTCQMLYAQMNGDAVTRGIRVKGKIIDA